MARESCRPYSPAAGSDSSHELVISKILGTCRDALASFTLVMELRFKSYPEAHRLLSRVADDSDRLTLDLSNVQFVKPSLLVAVAAVASAHYVRLGHPPRFVPPAERDPGMYASRMSLGEVLSDLGVGATGLPSVRHHEREQQLCELTRFESNDDAASLVNLVQHRCQGESMPFEIEDALTHAVWELADNCLAHSRSGFGFLAAQVLTRPRRALHFAVADDGIGIRASLVGTEHEHAVDEMAILAAAQRRVTSVPGKERGVGLPNLLSLATSVGGEVTIRSGEAAVVFRAEAIDGQLRTRTTNVDELAGTLVSGWLPC